MKKIIAIIGARPQFIKHAPIEIAAKGKVELITIHTGQHYDEKMSQVFFDQLGMSKPKYMLEVGSHSHAKQTALMMEKIEPILQSEKPDVVLLYGDTNSTLAGALVTSKMQIPIAHIEAGLRSFNREMPEEINRVLTDHVSDFLFTPTQTAIDNLKKEGITKNVFNVGDVMCDMIRIAEKKIIQKQEITEKYYFATLHRPYNTDSKDRLIAILKTMNALKYKVVFSLHPRTENLLKSYGFNIGDLKNIKFIPPASYIETVNYLSGCECLITDSGGMQKEAYMLKKKCITVRKETEWVETLENAWNTLVFDDIENIKNEMQKPTGTYIPNLYGDGKAAEKIIEILS